MASWYATKLRESRCQLTNIVIGYHQACGCSNNIVIDGRLSKHGATLVAKHHLGDKFIIQKLDRAWEYNKYCAVVGAERELVRY